MSTADIIKTALRLPKPLHEQVHASARASGRSFNSEIIECLTRALSEPPASSDEAASLRLENAQLRSHVEMLRGALERDTDLISTLIDRIQAQEADAPTGKRRRQA